MLFISGPDRGIPLIANARRQEEVMGKVSVFGDSILKGVQVENAGGKYVVNDSLGFSSIASQAGLSVENFSKFGCTITKAWAYIQKMFSRIDADIVFMDFGGNDCDFDWDAVSKSPLNIHKPKTDYYDFVSTYNTVVDYIKEKRRLPIVATLVPVQPEMYLNHICKTRRVDRKSIHRWMQNDVCRLENLQKSYSDAVKGISCNREVPLLDIRSAFEDYSRPESLLCSDGIHPNLKGQRVIRDCFQAFISDYLTF